MIPIPYKPEALELLQAGAIALAEVECNGMAVDTGYVRKALKRTRRKIKRKQEELESDEVMCLWRKTYRTRTNPGSTEQLGHVLFDVMGIPAPTQTARGRHKTDEKTLSDVDVPFVRKYLEIKKLEKAANTYLKGILRETVGGRVHPFFNLHLVLSYRSSSDSPNFQNMPARDPMISKLIRRAFVASPGNQIVEIDYSGAEVVVAACYHKDPVMIEYILDPAKDMHRDTAMELFKLPAAEMNKAIRNIAKTWFVFAQFYGDWYIDCAPNLWKAAAKAETVSGVPLHKHLASVGIKSLGACDPKGRPRDGTFEQRVYQTEQAFWGERFRVYAQWKRDWVEEYRRRGFIETHTGFICQGYMKKNEVVNYPIQGSAFHCLLWSLIRLVRDELKKRSMKSIIVGQIHDSIVADVVPSERDEFIHLCRRVMTLKILKAYPWLIVPMKIEAEVSPVGGTWADKQKYELKD